MENDIILITGCSSGLGKRLCILLKEKGYRVVATARDISKLNQVPADSKLEMDVTDAQSIENAIGTVIRRYGRIDVLINNAGYSIRTAIEEIDLKEMSEMFEVNVYGSIRMIQAAAPYMREQNSGKIINIGSISGRLTGYVNGAYCASKHAIEAISDAARMELQGFGIQVSVLEPGAINTEFFKTLAKNSDEKMKNNRSPYMTLYQKDLDYRKKQKRADTEKAAEAIYRILIKNKLKARYLIAVPKIFHLFLILPDIIREKIMLFLIR